MKKQILALILDADLVAEFIKSIRTTIINTTVTGRLELRGIKDGKVYASVRDSDTLYEVPIESIYSDKYIAQAVTSGVVMDETIEEDDDSTLIQYEGILYQRSNTLSTYRKIVNGTIDVV